MVGGVVVVGVFVVVYGYGVVDEEDDCLLEEVVKDDYMMYIIKWMIEIWNFFLWVG